MWDADVDAIPKCPKSSSKKVVVYQIGSKLREDGSHLHKIRDPKRTALIGQMQCTLSAGASKGVECPQAASMHGIGII